MRVHLKLASDLKVFTEGERTVRNSIYEYEQRARDYRQQHEKYIQQIRDFTNASIKRGVVVVDGDEMDNACRNSIHDTLKGYLAKVFKEIERPLIMLTKEEGRRKKKHGGSTPWRNYYKLVIPKVARLKNLASGLLIIAEQGGEDHEHVPIVEAEQLTDKWIFIFSDRAESKEIMNHWLQQVDNDPVFRTCLDTGYYP